MVRGLPSTESCLSWRPLSFRKRDDRPLEDASGVHRIAQRYRFHGYSFLMRIHRFPARHPRVDAFRAGIDFIRKLKLLFRPVAVPGPQSFQQILVARRVTLPFELRREAFANRDNDSPRWLTASGQFSQVSIFGSS